MQPGSISICYELETGKQQNAEKQGSNLMFSWGALSSSRAVTKDPAAVWKMSIDCPEGTRSSTFPRAWRAKCRRCCELGCTPSTRLGTSQETFLPGANAADKPSALLASPQKTPKQSPSRATKKLEPEARKCPLKAFLFPSFKVTGYTNITL